MCDLERLDNCTNTTETAEEKERYSCNHENCRRLFSSQGRLQNHERLIHGEELPFRCTFPSCEKSFTKLRYLKVHNKTHREKKYHCAHCSYAAHQKAYLVNHMQKNLHLKEPSSIIIKTNYKCKICHKIFFKKDACAKHSLIHKKPRYFCEVCPYESYFQYQLKRHIKLHENSKKKFFCSYCTKGYSSKRGLRRHFNKVHPIEIRGLKCPHCTEILFSFQSLVKHIHKLHRFGCAFDYCEKTFQSERELLFHVYTTHVCWFCDNVYLYGDGLKNHIRTHYFL